MTNRARLLLMLALVAQNGIARAQSQRITGRALRADSAPIANVRVTATIVRNSAGARTASSAEDGRFVLNLTPADWRIEMRAIGFKPWSGTIRLKPGDTTSFVAMMEVLPPQTLDAVTVRASLSNLEGFEERRARGPGTFFTREDMRKMQPRVFTDVLRRAPGIFLRGVPTGFGEQLTAMSSRTRPCPVAYVLNGSPLTMPHEMAVDSYIVASDVIAVEVYAGSSQIPPQFNASAGTARCGVIVIWTRNGRAP
jgi:hypothetical protein